LPQFRWLHRAPCSGTTHMEPRPRYAIRMTLRWNDAQDDGQLFPLTHRLRQAPDSGQHNVDGRRDLATPSHLTRYYTLSAKVGGASEVLSALERKRIRVIALRARLFSPSVSLCPQCAETGVGRAPKRLYLVQPAAPDCSCHRLQRRLR
jgi:hypothetical protein